MRISGLWAACFILLLPLMARAAATPAAGCNEQALRDLQREVLALESIDTHFSDLARGELSTDFSLSSIFTISLLDSNDVTARIRELNMQTRPGAGAYSHCQSADFKAARNQRDAHARNISQLRLAYLRLALDERRYLNALIDILQQYQHQLLKLEQNLADSESVLAALREQRAELEAAFETQENPKERASLSESILAIDRQTEAINSQQKSDRKRLKKLTGMVAFSRALLIDYHLVYIDTGNLQNATNAMPPFIQLVGGSSLRQLLQIPPAGNDADAVVADSAADAASNSNATENNPPDLLTGTERINLAALFIIHSRIYSDKRERLGLLAALPSGSMGFVAALEHELKTLLALPVANLHLKFAKTEQDYSYLSRNFFQSATNLLTQIIVALLLWAIVKRVREWVYSLQRYLVKNYLSKRFSRLAIGLLRTLQPNASWLTAFGFFSYLNQLEQDRLRDLILLYDVTAILTFYLFINTLTTWAIGNTNSQAHLFVMKSRQETIARYCHHFAFNVTLFSLFYIVLNSILHGGIITSLYAVALIVIIWLFTYNLIRHFASELDTHLSKRVSESTQNRFHQIQKPLLKQSLTPVVFIALQIRDLINAIHNQLLRLESYQAMTAKFLKIRLEQSQSATEPVDKGTQEDTHYESWFLNRDLPIEKPALVMASPWVKELDKICHEWLEGKQEENDLALIGECGIGKSTLIRQWQDKWQDSKTLLLTVTEKTTTEDGIFNLVKEALGISSGADIAQFVNEQKELDKTIIVIDEAQNLFLGDVGCFNAYKMLQSLISAKLENIFWIVAINQQSWIYLNDVFSRTYQFSSRINIQRWSQQEIRELILSRHRASKRRLRYDELLLASTAHSETATRAAEARCFSLLWDQSSGIPAVALSIWVNAARHPGRGQIEMGIPERPVSSVMLELSDDHLFVYAALITHETLNTQQAQAVTHLAEPIVRRALKLGLDQGFVIRKNRGRYTINSLWYIQLCQLLRRKNFLHE